MFEQFVLHKNKTVYFTSPLFDNHKIPHAFFTRHGGVSNPPFDSLNFAVGTGAVRDSAENVLANHRLGAKVFGLDESYVCRTFQTHTVRVIEATENERGTGTVKPPFDFDVDGLVCRCKDVILSVRSADCVPILLYDIKNNICAAVHSGWRGTVGRISANAIKMMTEMGSSLKDIVAAIGPCAGVCCYEVGSELYDEFLSAEFDCQAHFLKGKKGKFMLDLTGVNEDILVECGVEKSNISASRICTCCNTDLFFSHRVMGGNRGTMASFIMNRR